VAVDLNKVKNKSVIDQIKDNPLLLSAWKADECPDANERRIFETDRVTNTFPCDFNFIEKAHGLRRKEVYLLLADKGKGKTTLMRSIIRKLIKNNRKIMTYCTEEDTSVYMGQILVGDETDDFRDRIIAIGEKNKLKHIKANTEMSIKSKRNEMMIHLEMNLKEHQPDLLILDNLSTGMFYDELKKEDCLDTLFILSELAQKYNIPIITISHIVTTETKLPYTTSSVRGNKSFVNGVENCLAIYTVSIQDPISLETELYSCVHWIASRNQGQVIGKFFLLNYDNNFRVYTSDVELDAGVFYKNFVNKQTFKTTEDIAQKKRDLQSKKEYLALKKKYKNGPQPETKTPAELFFEDL
jgi:archaellum biogenesis ATPase FlaH